MYRYVKLEPEEAQWIKKHIDVSKKTFENILRHILEYQYLRKKEIATKNKLKLSLSQLKSKLNQMELMFPENERKTAHRSIENKEIYKRKTDSEEEISKRLVHLHNLIKRRENRETELTEIKRKLERLQK